MADQALLAELRRELSTTELTFMLFLKMMKEAGQQDLFRPRQPRWRVLGWRVAFA